MKNHKSNQFRFHIDNIYTLIDGEKFVSIGSFPNNDDFIHDLKRVYRRYGFIIKTKPDLINQNKVQIYWKKINEGKK